MSPLAVSGIGFVAPGLVGWEAARDCLRGIRPYRPGPLPKLNPEWLPANERRRLSATMRLALSAGREAVQGADAAVLATVFASATGDGAIIHAVCEELARPAPAVSPTQFHNSVHNAPAGYWSIAAQSRAASTAVAAHDASFAAGLLEAAAITRECDGVLLVAYDQPLPFPLCEKREIAAPFACALLLGPAESGGAATLSLRIVPGGDESRLADGELEALRAGNPAARALPLLALLAGAAEGCASLPYLQGTSLKVEVARR